MPETYKIGFMDLNFTYLVQPHHSYQLFSDVEGNFVLVKTQCKLP